MRARIFLALHALVVLLPLLGLVFGWPDARLFGTEAPARPTLSFREWSREETQRATRTWFEEHLGFRGVLVRTDNTLFYDSLGETRPGSVTKRGEHETLFIDEDFLYSAARPQDLSAMGKLPELAGLIADVQRRLRAKNRRLVFVISPAKTSIYPDEIPGWLRRRDPALAVADSLAYRPFLQALRDAGAEYADGRDVLTHAPGPREIGCTRTGRHWTRTGACWVLRSGTRDIFPDMECRYEMRDVDPAVDASFDLWRLLNTWRLSPPDTRIATLVDVHLERARPSALFVGTSFSWELSAAARPFVGDVRFFYYNKTHFDLTPPNAVLVGPVDTDEAAWRRVAADRDLYVVELLESYLPGDFVREFLTTLRDRM